VQSQNKINENGERGIFKVNIFVPDSKPNEMKNPALSIIVLILVLSFNSCRQEVVFTPEQEALFNEAAANGPVVNEGYERCLKFLHAWIDLRDSVTGLIPRNINDAKSKDIWNAKDCAADNYPFMVLTTTLLDKDLFNGTMMDMLEAEKRITSRVGSMPDTWSFSKRQFAAEDPVMSDIIFGSAEYIKDGLIPLTEWLGPSPWSERMISILDDIWKYAPYETRFGIIPSDDPEVNGDMLQSLSRIFWITGDKKYLEWAERLGDYYLLGNKHPTRDFKVLRLRDHGCEIVSGLCELYATVSFADPPKKELYKESLYTMLDRILETGRNEDGLFYNSIDPVKGVPVNEGIADNFGYTLNGFYTVYLLDSVERFRKPVIKALDVLNSRYRNYAWEGTSQDGYADAIEGALNLYVREPVPSAREWIDSETKVLWGKQQPSGIIEGWHGDGNFARTTIMYCLWKSGGAHLSPWSESLQPGGVYKDSVLYLTLNSSKDWKGNLIFDIDRHRENMHLPLDWPRINQFPEYFTIKKGKSYRIMTGNTNKEQIINGIDLINGYAIKIHAGRPFKLMIQEL